MLIFIPALLQSRPIVLITIARMKDKFPAANILIVTPNVEDYIDLVTSNLKVLPDAQFAEVGKKELESYLSASKSILSGWYYQQLLKYAVLSKVEDDEVLVIDADTVILGDTSFKLNSFPTSAEYHQPYFDCFYSIFKKTAPFKASAITNFMWFQTALLRQMLKEIEIIHYGIWWEIIIGKANEIDSDFAFSEYETYANWVSIKNHGHLEEPINIFRRGDFLTKNNTDYQSIVNKVNSMGYFAVAFEFNHTKGFFRKILAWFLLNLGIKWW
jgi:hypothetical protein